MSETGEGRFTIELPLVAAKPVLAVGGELKNSICAIEGHRATMSPPIGALSDADNYRRFIHELDQAVEGLLSRSAPGPVPALVVAHDLHPTYLSTVAGQQLGAKLSPAVCEGVQHHHAHVAACLAEHGVSKPVIGIACDGTGYGTDGAIWGCEVLRATPADFVRCAHLDYFPLPGGDAAARQTWRPALSLIHAAFGGDPPDHIRERFARVAARELETVRTMLNKGLNCPPTSSLGRLFDAAAYLCGLCDANEFEGQAAISLQEAASEAGVAEPYSFRLVGDDGGTRIVVSDMIVEICEDLREDEPPQTVAARFHATLACMLSEAALVAARSHGLDTAVLTGGCFLNEILANRTAELLLKGGMKTVLEHDRLSPGDGSLSLGQAYAAAARQEGEA
jgi:hydrogenase maturation protein HypF